MARTVARVSQTQRAKLDALAAAHEARKQAEADYLTALIEARDSAVTIQAMADAIGVRRESVRRYLARNAPE